MSPSTPDQTKWQHLKERPFEIQDDWGESTTRMGESTTQSWGGSPHRSMSSTQGSPWRSPQSRRSKMGDSRSAPLLPAANSTHSSTWYSASDASSRTLSAQGPPLWSALAGTWRQRSTDEFGVSVRKNADDGSAFRARLCTALECDESAQAQGVRACTDMVLLPDAAARDASRS